MRASPLQLVNLRFLKVQIEPTEVPDPTEPKPRVEGEPFDFSGVGIQTELGHGHGEVQGSEDAEIQPFMVTLAVRLTGEVGKQPPYRIDVKCAGYFTISVKAFTDSKRREDVAVVNGASMLYSSIRDLVSSVTSRSWGGEMLLPTMNFQNDAPNGTNLPNGGTSQETETPAVKKRSVKARQTQH